MRTSSNSVSAASTGLASAKSTVRNIVAVLLDPAGSVARSPVASLGTDLRIKWVQSSGGLSPTRVPGCRKTSFGWPNPTAFAASSETSNPAPAERLIAPAAIEIGIRNADKKSCRRPTMHPPDAIVPLLMRGWFEPRASLPASSTE